MRLNREGGAVPLARENQKRHQAFSLGNNKLNYIRGTSNARVLIPKPFFLGLFSKDARVVIGSFFSRTQFICCNNVTY